MLASLFLEYRSPARESRFLGAGWGMRDVRGPYIISSSAKLEITRTLFSTVRRMKLTLTLESSNRLQSDAMLVGLSCERRKETIVLKRNRSTLVEIPDISCPSTEFFELSISVAQLDVIALNWLRLEMQSS